MSVLRFGTFLAPNMQSTYETIAEAVGRRLGLETELVVETSYESCKNDVNDVCFVCSLPYIMFERDGISPAVPVAAPVLRGTRYANRPIYFSDVIVHRDSDATSFEDLRGKSWAYNEPLSQSGYGITRYHLLELGETQGFFGEVIETGFHDTSIELVTNGFIDSSAIDSQVLAIAFDRDPDLREQLKVIDTLGPSTIQPIAVTKRFSANKRARIQQALIDLGDDPLVQPALAAGMITRIAPIGPDGYDDVRNMLQACIEAGFMDLG